MQALRTFSPEDQRAFLRFVTSVSRGPLLGFRYLEPPLCIQARMDTLCQTVQLHGAAVVYWPCTPLRA